MRSCAGRSRLLPLLVAAVVKAAVLPGCCPIESRYFKPELRDFDTPAGIEDVWVDASGGGRLHAWFIPAPSLRDGAGHAPVVLFLHGSRTQIDSLELIVHGDQDTRVSVRHAREMYVRAQAAHVDAQLYVAPGAGHHDVLQVDPGAMDAIVDFVRVSRGARD